MLYNTLNRFKIQFIKKGVNKMAGRVRKRGNKWYYTLELGIVDGKRKQVERVGGSTKKDAEIALSNAILEFNTKGIAPRTKLEQISFQTLFSRWLETEGTGRKYATVIRYKSLYNNHLYVFGGNAVNNINSDMIQKLLEGKRDVLSDEYIVSISNLLRLLFRFALNKKYIHENPMKSVKYRAEKINKLEKLEDQTYTKDEISILLGRSKSLALHSAIMLGVHLGLRAGECYALRWSDIDFEMNIVRISKQLQYEYRKWSFTTLKTENSYREIVFGETLRTYLLGLKTEQDENRNFLGVYYKNNVVYDKVNKKDVAVSDFINIKPDGEMLNTNSNRVLSRIVKKEDLLGGKEFKFHSLRHTHATVLLEQGLNPKLIQERLGHSKLDFTLKLYTHVTRKMEKATADAIDDYFN